MKELLDLVVKIYCQQWISAGVNFEYIIRDFYIEKERIIELWVMPVKTDNKLLLIKTSYVGNCTDDQIYARIIYEISNAGLSNIYHTSVTLMREGKIMPRCADPSSIPLTPQETWLNKGPHKISSDIKDSHAANFNPDAGNTKAE